MCKCSYYVFFLHINKHFNNVHKRFSKLDNKLTRVSNEIFVVTKLKTVQKLEQLDTREQKSYSSEHWQNINIVIV